MQPCSREMQGMPSMASCLDGSSSQISLQELQNGQQIQNPNLQNFDHSSSHDDFFDQMLSTLPSWTDLATANPKSPWDLTNPNYGSKGQKLFGVSQPGKPEDQRSAAEGLNYPATNYDESALLASRLRQHQISGGGSSPSGKHILLQLNHRLSSQQQQEQMMVPGMTRSTTSDDSGLVPLPLSLGSGDSSDSRLLVDRSRDEIDAASFKSLNPSEGDGLFNGFGGSLHRAANQQHFHHTQAGTMPSQAYGTPAAVMGQGPATGGGASSGIAPPRQRVRARRGQATDPHSIAERLRRERIAERMKALQELVPNANKTDKASMLDEIIDYVKFLQLQVKVLSMSRLGGAAAVAPLVADISPEHVGAMGRGNVSSQAAASGSDSLTVTEQQVAKLMEEDMGSAMQYLQGKGLCLMPISLASALSTATCHSRTPGTGSGNSLLPPHPHPSNADGPSSPSMSVLTVQSAMANGADTDVSRPLVKDAASVSKQ